MLIERHDNESTGVDKWDDEPRKPWSAWCECGFHSNHSSENAAQRARLKHMHDEGLFLEQVAMAEARVQDATAALYRAMRDKAEAVQALEDMRRNK